jgi:predicted exporter
MREPAPQRSVGRGLRALLRKRAVQLWLLFLLVCALVIHSAAFTADLSAFLPRGPSAEQRVLVDQLRDGLVSRLMLVAIEGGDAQGRAALSRRLFATLRRDPQFASVNNGEPITDERDQQVIFDHRYLLSPSVTRERFTVEGLHQALGDSFDLLSSSAGLMVETLLPHDPTGEVSAMTSQLGSGGQPRSMNGVWASRDGARAVLVIETAGAGSDTDAQERAIRAVRVAFDTALHEAGNASPYHLLLTGPGVISVETRDTIKHDVERLSSASLALIVGLLLVVYRSPITLALGLLPVLSGVAAGLASVTLAFGTVHGLTLGFGTTLIGEAVDYSIYLFVQSTGSAAASGQASRPAESMRAWLAAYWPTIRLGVLTSVCGFASMLFSGFPGLVQLGLYSIAGLIAAAAVTRYVLPHMRDRAGTMRDVSRLGATLTGAVRAAPTLRWPLAAVLATSIAVLVMHRGQLWGHELSALSPVPAQSQALDASLRADLGAPDVRYLVVISATSEQTVLEGAEKIAAQLQPLVDKGVIAGYESAAQYLPSNATQRARLASLPPADVLAQRVHSALEHQPVSVEPAVFAPFIADVQSARRQPLLTRTDLQGTSMALAVDALLTEHAGQWRAMITLRAPSSVSAPPLTEAPRASGASRSQDPSLDAGAIRAAVARAGVDNALFVDMKAEADRLYVDYLHEEIGLSLAGFAAVTVLLLFSLRDPRRVARTLAPLVAAVLVVSAGFALAHVPLTILHLIGLLLIVAVGSNYALFFNPGTRGGDAAPAKTQFIAAPTLVSLLIANLATVAGFGLLALSRVPMLESFGLTVGPGAILALVFSAILAPQASRTPSLKCECEGKRAGRPI